MSLCRDVHHGWMCTLDLGHHGYHVDRSLLDGFVYASWPQTVSPVGPITQGESAGDTVPSPAHLSQGEPT